jgi:magnesium transporter
VITTATAPLPPSLDDDIDHDALDEDYVLTASFVEKVVDASDAGDGLKLRSLLEDLHPADVADLMGFLTAEHRAVVVLWLPADLCWSASRT